MENQVSISAALLPLHLETTAYFAQVLPVSHHSDEIDRAVKVAGLASMVPIDNLDAAWALQTLAGEVRHLQSLLARTERQLATNKILLLICCVAFSAALVVIGWFSMRLLHGDAP